MSDKSYKAIPVVTVIGCCLGVYRSNPIVPLLGCNCGC